jgi:hypothetical protein
MATPSQAFPAAPPVPNCISLAAPKMLLPECTLGAPDSPLALSVPIPASTIHGIRAGHEGASAVGLTERESIG